MSRGIRKAAVVAMLGVTAGCTAGGGLFSGTDQALPTGSGAAADSLDFQTLDAYLQLMNDLLEGDTVAQAEAFQRATADEAADANTTNRLRLALALATPGHAGSNGEHAQRELRELLAASELLLPEERILAAMMLAQIEQRILLDAEAEQTQAAAIRTMEEQAQALETRAQRLQDENQSLRSQLEEAQNIIDEITNIEQSIRERASAD